MEQVNVLTKEKPSPAQNRTADQPVVDPDARAAYALPEPQSYEPGTILTLRMRGHARSPVPGEEYFAPAVVLRQYNNQTGDIEAIVWDSSAGQHYGVFHAREVSSRGNGNERELYESQSNVGEVLYSPWQFANACNMINLLDRGMANLQNESVCDGERIVELFHTVARLTERIGQLEAAVTAPAGAAPVNVVPIVATGNTAPDAAKPPSKK